MTATSSRLRRQTLVDAEADDEGRVRVADLHLDQVRADTDDSPGGASALAAAEERLASAVRRLQRSRDALVEHDMDAASVTQDPQLEDQTPADRPMVYQSAADWVEQYLVPQWRRDPVGQAWCQRWWLHGEAMSRFEALWRSWEHLRYEGPLGMAIWWRDYADYHLRELTSKGGPFGDCEAATGHHQQPPILRVQPAPRELRQPLPADDGR